MKKIIIIALFIILGIKSINAVPAAANALHSFSAIFINPFTDYVFMQRALTTCIALSCVCPILGIILLLKKMSLMGEALSHGILPGIVIAFFLWGIWLPGFSIGGILIGLIIAGLSVIVTQKTRLPQDASFSGFYLIALALGVLLVSQTGGAMNVMHLLFGTVLGVNENLLYTNIIVSVLTLIILRVIARPLIYQCFDPLFMQSVGCGGNRYTIIFTSLVVINLVQACQALGTLMALGLMMIPAITARLMAHRLKWTLYSAIGIALISSYSGLVIAFHGALPPGPTIVLVAGCFYIIILFRILVIKLSHNFQNKLHP